MKQNDTVAFKKAKKPQGLPLKIKLISAFLLFTALILFMLWLFQTVLLDDFYEIIKRNQIEKTADYICRHIDDDGIEDYIADVYNKNDTIAEVYDTTGDYFARIYSYETDTNIGMNILPHEVFACYEKAKALGGRAVIDDESEFFSKDNPYKDMPELDRSNERKITCAQILTRADGREFMVILRSPMTPVSSAVQTLRIQLLIVSIILALTGIVFAVVVSANISRPLIKTNKGAKELAKQNYDVGFSDKGYREIRELNETLNFASKELSAVDGLRRELVANISHDLRTPLTMISGYAEVMRDIPGENSPENLQVIIDESQRLSQLVTDLLDLSKLESGSTPIKRERFCLTDSVRSIFTRYSKLISTEDYNLHFEYNENVDVIGDEIRLSQVIYNLINNAINYSGVDKTVTVTQRLTPSGVRIEVTDKGKGIDPCDLKNIWDRYYRVDKEHKSAVIGTGLGLSIAKNILLQHNARFGVTSAKGVGSTFWFELRVQEIKPIDKQ